MSIYTEVSAHAYPATLVAGNDWTPYTGENPAFTVQRTPYGQVEGGDYVRGSNNPATPASALRYTVAQLAPTEIASNFTLVTQVTGYDTINISWGWPKTYEGWEKLAVIKSGFGYPNTVNDGTVVLAYDRSEWDFVDGSPVSIVFTDTKLHPGNWVYYTLFFFNGVEWQEASRSSALLPKDYGHGDHLWNSLPPYYRQVDDAFRPNNGFLRQFLNIFGEELDLVRNYIESWQNTFNVDKAPMSLLRHLGENLGVPFEGGLGDIRYRNMLSRIAEMHSYRGTPEGLRILLESSTKYNTFLTVGNNLLKLNDDSEFVTGTGSWAAYPGGKDISSGMVATPYNDVSVTVTPYNATVYNNKILEGGVAASSYLYVDTDPIEVGVTAYPFLINTDVQNVFAYADTSDVGVSAYGASIWTYASSLILQAPFMPSSYADNAGRSAMNVGTTKQQETSTVVLACGIGTRFDGVTMSPKYNAAPATGNKVYGFQCRLAGPNSDIVKAALAWFDKDERLIGVSYGENVPHTYTWDSVTIQALSPDVTQFAVPILICKNRSQTVGDSPASTFSIMGCMLYLLGDGDVVAAYLPDDYLTLHNENELIGDNDLDVIPPEYISDIGKLKLIGD